MWNTCFWSVRYTQQIGNWQMAVGKQKTVCHLKLAPGDGLNAKSILLRTNPDLSVFTISFFANCTLVIANYLLLFSYPALIAS